MIFAKEVLKVSEDSEYIAHRVKRKKVTINRLNVQHQNNRNVNINHHIETNMIVNMNEIPIERNNNIEVTLPSYEPDLLPTTNWHDYTAEQIVNIINSRYDDIIHWKKNLLNYQMVTATGFEPTTT